MELKCALEHGHVNLTKSRGYYDVIEFTLIPKLFFSRQSYVTFGTRYE